MKYWKNSSPSSMTKELIDDWIWWRMLAIDVYDIHGQCHSPIIKNKYQLCIWSMDGMLLTPLDQYMLRGPKLDQLSYQKNMPSLVPSLR